MGNSLEAYRAAIGLFHAHTRKSNRPINFSAYSYKDIGGENSWSNKNVQANL
jgi:hypothetical protein